MKVTMTQPPKCSVVFLEEMREHLRVQTMTGEEEFFLQALIDAASSDAQTRIGRVLVESQWEWLLDGLTEAIAFPVAPVTKVEVYEKAQGSEEYTIRVSEALYDANLPSLQPLGKPLIGNLSPKDGFPDCSLSVSLTAGYPVQERLVKVNPGKSPEIALDKTGFSSNELTIVFDAPVFGEATSENFTVTQDGGVVSIAGVVVADGVVKVKCVDTIIAGKQIFASFVGGFIRDEFGNYARPFANIGFGEVSYKPFSVPAAIPTVSEFFSLCPEPIKQWIKVRVATLFTQRTEVALRSGKANDALFPRQFIDCLLDPYRILVV